MKQKNLTPLLFGISFIIFGIIFLGNSLFGWNIQVFFDGWWTLFILVPSLIGILTNGPKVYLFEFIFIGIALLLWQQNIIELNVTLILIIASALIAIGTACIIHYFKPQKATTYRKVGSTVYIQNKNENPDCTNSKKVSININEQGVSVNGSGVQIDSSTYYPNQNKYNNHGENN